jgi:hypothetical protein
MVPMTQLVTEHDEIEALLTKWQPVLQRDYGAYRGHVYRVFNYCRGLATAEGSAGDAKIAVAAVFHDLGIWSEQTLDYLEPSVTLAEQYLVDTRRAMWADEVASMIRQHHALRPVQQEGGPLVEAFRRADLVDLSCGWIRSGLAADVVRRARAEFPYAGFHLRITGLVLGWAVRHPLKPFPMMKL